MQASSRGNHALTQPVLWPMVGQDLVHEPAGSAGVALGDKAKVRVEDTEPPRLVLIASMASLSVG
jgi:hypothetical protein